MSVWLPRRPPSSIARRYTRFIPGLPGRRVFPHNGLSNNLELGLSSLVIKRSQSTKDSASPRNAHTVAEGRSISDSKPSPPSLPKDDTPKAPLATRVWKKVKHEAAHYWHGSKLLVSEVRISARLQWKILQGETLTRRERRQVSSRALHLVI